MKAFIREQLPVRAIDAVPGLSLHLAPEPVPLWEALEAHSGKREAPPFWAHAWPGGLALARALLEDPSLVRGRTVLDFGSGCGVAAIAAVKAGAQVTACEVDPWAIAAIELNAALNGVTLATHLGDLLGAKITWDVVLVGDVFYEGPLSALISRWLSGSTAQVLVGDPGRQFMPVDRLECLQTFQLAANPAWDSVLDRPARVWRWRHGASM